MDAAHAEQLRRRQVEPLSLTQRQEAERLSGPSEHWRSEVAAILELAEELRDQTMEALLRQSDLEVGLEALLGRGPRRGRRRR